jgi:hypothetical protein
MYMHLFEACQLPEVELAGAAERYEGVVDTFV